MAFLLMKNRNQKCLALALFILIFLWTSTESIIGSGVDDPITFLKSSRLTTVSAGEFTVITYNVAGLPGFISSAATERSSSIAEIGRLLNRYDIAHVQEDFNYNKYLYGKGNTHAYRTHSKGKVPFGDGLNTLSKFPVHQTQRIAWNNCTGADCLTPKGFSFSRIEVAENVFIDFYNVHANAYNHLAAAAARRKNIRQLSDYISAHSGRNAVIVMGDLNAHYGFYYDNIRLLNSANRLKDVWMSQKKNDLYPALSTEFPSDDILAVTDTCETIDKILYRSSDELSLETTDYQLENRLFCNKEGVPLSDHHPVSARFLWRVRGVGQRLVRQISPEPF